jgi:hypothetical protein
MSSTADENIHHITVEELMNEKAPCYYWIHVELINSTHEVFLVVFSCCLQWWTFLSRLVSELSPTSVPAPHFTQLSQPAESKYGFVDMGCPLWWEDRSVVYNCYWPHQCSNSRVQVPLDLRPYFFTVRDFRLPHPGGPGLSIYIPQEQGCPVISPGCIELLVII